MNAAIGNPALAMNAGERTRMYQVRPRRIPPEFCSDELLEECSVLSALLLYRLISLADDQGRLPGHPKTIRASAFALRPAVTVAKIDRSLSELTRVGFILCYDVGGRRYVQVNAWWDMQGKWGQRRTYPSRYPAPPGWRTDWVTAGTDSSEVRAPDAQSSGDVRPPSSLASSSSSTTPSSYRAEAPGPERLDHLLARARQGHLSDDDAVVLANVALQDLERVDEDR